MFFPVSWLAGRMSICSADNNIDWFWNNTYLELCHTEDCTSYPFITKDILADVVHDGLGGDEELHHDQPAVGGGERAFQC